jgi:hypothetical protein
MISKSSSSEELTLIKSPHRGYVALAVSGGPKGTVSKDLNTDCGNDRTKNMVAFAVEALKLVKEVISGDEAKI